MAVSYGFFFFQAEDGIRDLVRSRGLGDVYKRQLVQLLPVATVLRRESLAQLLEPGFQRRDLDLDLTCLLYTSDAADERSSVDLGGRRIIKKKNQNVTRTLTDEYHTLELHVREMSNPRHRRCTAAAT